MASEASAAGSAPPKAPIAAAPARTIPTAAPEGAPAQAQTPQARPAPRKPPAARRRPAPRKPKRKAGPVRLPSLELLTPAGPEGQPVSATELDAAADLLEATLRSFGVEGEVKDVRPGPVVTTFEYQPGHTVAHQYEALAKRLDKGLGGGLGREAA